jgi:hypothetical protein
VGTPQTTPAPATINASSTTATVPNTAATSAHSFPVDQDAAIMGQPTDNSGDAAAGAWLHQFAARAP